MLRPFAALLGLVFLIAAVYSGDHFVRDIDHSNRLDAIHNGSRTLLITLLNAETGERGYVITGNEDYLGPYNTSIGVIDTYLDSLAQLLQTTDTTFPQVPILKDLINKKLDELAATIELRRQSFDQAAAFVNQHLGKNYMDQIRDRLAVLDLWSERGAAIDNMNATFFARSAFVSMILSLAFGIIATFNWKWLRP